MLEDLDSGTCLDWHCLKSTSKGICPLYLGEPDKGQLGQRSRLFNQSPQIETWGCGCADQRLFSYLFLLRGHLSANDHAKSFAPYAGTLMARTEPKDQNSEMLLFVRLSA